MAYEITEVRTEQPVGHDHPHITEVKLSNGTVETRVEVVNYINQGLEYVTTAPGAPQAKVIVVDCPHCSGSDYITTEPDSTTKNNLLDLPFF